VPNDTVNAAAAEDDPLPQRAIRRARIGLFVGGRGQSTPTTVYRAKNHRTIYSCESSPGFEC